MIEFKNFDSLIQIMDYFTDEDVCIQAIVEKRWGKGEEQDIVCPYCGGHHCVARKDKRFRCHQCDRNFSCKVGTIFEDSNLSLQKWFVAMYLISSHKKGISSCQLARDIKVTQKTAWLCFRRFVCSISRAMQMPFKVLLSVMRCISVARRNGSTSLCAHHTFKVVQL